MTVWKTVLRDSLGRLSHKTVPQDCPTRLSHKTVPQDCPTRLSHKTVPQDCPTTLSARAEKKFPQSTGRETAFRIESRKAVLVGLLVTRGKLVTRDEV